MKPHVVYSNRMEELARALEERLLEGRPLDERLVVVPTAGIKGWIQRWMADRLGVAMGVRFLFLEELFRKGWPGEVELTLRLEQMLGEVEEVREYVQAPGRLCGLAGVLAGHFSQYAIYGRGAIEGWQRELWKQLFGEVESSGKCVHLFGFSHIPRLYKELLGENGVYYVLSPCAMYWEDTRSEREQRRLLRFFREQGAKEGQLDELDSYFRDTNLLVGNWGRVGRQFVALLDGCETEERYVEPEQATLLAQVQRDLLLLSPEGPKLESDESIELHVAPNRWREVEALHGRLVELLSGGEMGPEDVVVMAPSISEYSPYIRAVFGCEGVLPVQIQDLQSPEPGSCTEGMLRVLELAESRWEASRIVELLEHPLSGWNEEEVETIRHWIEKAGIRWGLDQEHRKRKLRSTRAGGGHTWEEGLNLLARSLVTGEGVRVDFSDCDLLERFVGWLEELVARLGELSSCFTVQGWVGRLRELADALFEAGDGQWEGALRQLASARVEGEFPFLSIRTLIERLIGARSHTYNGNALDAVRCCSMLPMRAIPAKVVCVLGLSEEAFPRPVVRKPFDLLVGNPKSDYRPTMADLDRYLFLEAVLSAREHFLMFYPGFEQGEELEPSSVVSDLQAFCEEAYGMRLEAKRHPYLSCHWSYFQKGKPGSTHQYARAAARYGGEASPIRWTVPEVEERSTLDLRDLRMSASDPSRLFLNRVLGMKLEREEEKLDDEPFILSPLAQHRMAWEGLERPLDEVLAREEALGQLPKGPMGALALEKLEERLAELQGRLVDYGVEAAGLTKLRLDKECKGPVQLAKSLWELPPIHLNGVDIVGEIPLVTPKGLFANARNDLGSVAKSWPSYLAFCAAEAEGEKSLLLARSRREMALSQEQAQEALGRYVAYHRECCVEPAPLSPDWLKFVMGGDVKGLAARIERDMRGGGFVSPYLRWLFGREAPTAEGVMARWEEPVVTGFGAMKGWFK